jgi:hypothetical protein
MHRSWDFEVEDALARLAVLRAQEAALDAKQSAMTGRVRSHARRRNATTCARSWTLTDFARTDIARAD